MTTTFSPHLQQSETLHLGSDLALRNRWFVPESFAHPAKLHLGFLRWLLEAYTSPDETIADPMCGIGSTLLAAAYGRNVIAREIEPRWLEILRANAAHIQQQAGLFAGAMDIGQADVREAWNWTADHTIALCETLGFVLHARHQRQVFPLSLWQRRRKERGEPVVEEEDALVFCKQEGTRWTL